MQLLIHAKKQKFVCKLQCGSLQSTMYCQDVARCLGFQEFRECCQKYYCDTAVKACYPGVSYTELTAVSGKAESRDCRSYPAQADSAPLHSRSELSPSMRRPAAAPALSD